MATHKLDLTALHQATRVACIGSTKTTEIKLCQVIGYFLATLGKEVATGNAIGADQAYAAGANAVDETLVHLFVTGTNHNKYAIRPGNHIHIDESPEWIEVAKFYHPKYDELDPYVQKLMNRNAGIVLNSQLVIAIPNPNKYWGGGTGHGMRIAKAFNIPLWNLLDTTLVSELESHMRDYLKGVRADHEIRRASSSS